MQTVGNSFRNLWVIFKHEFRLFFISPIVYLIGAVWFFFASGFFFYSLWQVNQGYGEPSMIGMFQPMIFLMVFIAPALTMRLVSEEIRTGTHELLFTAPVRDWEIVVGKWLSAWAVFTIFMLFTVLYPLLLGWRGSPEQSLIFTGYLGLWLLAGATLAIGVLASTLTQYQLVSFMISLGALLFLWLSTIPSQLIKNAHVNDFLYEISLTSHYQSLVQRALIDPTDIAYFVGLVAMALFLATQMLNSRRWSA